MEKIEISQRYLEEDDEELGNMDDVVTETDLLPADHPMMAKFQNALREHLMKMVNQLEDEITDINHAIELKNSEIAEYGSKLFDRRNEVERQREQLDKYNGQILTIAEKRKFHEDNVVKLKARYHQMEAASRELKNVNNQMSQELASMQFLESEIAKWNNEIQNEIALSKRIAGKDVKDQKSISEEKRKMDLLLLHLDAELNKKERELDNIEMQIQEYNSEIASLNQSLADSNVDLEGLKQEHKKLMQAWGEVIVAIEKRDKILSKVNMELDEQRELHKTINASIENTRKFVLKELETSDKLKEFKDRLLRDVTNIEKQVQILESEGIKVDQQLDHFSSILDKTSADLEQARSEGLLTKNHVNKLINKIEKLSREKFQVEEKLLELLQDQITTDKAGQHRGRLLRDSQEERRKLEILISQNENKLSIAILDMEKWRGNVQRAKENVERLKLEHDEVESESTMVNEEIEKLKAANKTKLIQLDLVHKEIERLIEQMGGREVNLKETEILDLEKRISEVDKKIKESQQFWLKTQSQVNALSERRAQQMDEIFVGRKQILVIEQKALRVQNELDSSQQEQREIQRTLQNYNVKLDQVSKKLYEKRKTHEKEVDECEMAHMDTVETLKKAEMSMLELEQNLENLTREIEELKNEVRDKHYEALSWETKFKLAQETKKMKHDELSQNSEIGFMKAEIHRMEVKFANLKKMQERMVNSLEQSVHHRDHIYDSALVREKKTGTKVKTQTNVKHKLNEIQNKLKFLCEELRGTQRQIREFEEKIRAVEQAIADTEQDIQNEKVQDCTLQSEIEHCSLQKQHNFENIVRRQRRARRYRALQTCNYLPKLKTDTAMDAEIQRQADISENLLGILESIRRDFPDQKLTVEKVFQTLKK